MELADKILEIFQLMPRVDRNLAGGMLYRSDIERQIRNYSEYMSSGVLPNRQRLNFGICDNNESPSGYCAFTILRNANSTEYEKKYIHLSGKLNYVQIKNIFVSQESRENGVGIDLINKIEKIAYSCKVGLCADVMDENYVAKLFFGVVGMKQKHSWTTPSGTPMIRFSL